MARAPDQSEAERLAEVVLALKRCGETITKAAIVAALLGSRRVLRDASVQGVPIEEVQAKAAARAKRNRAAAGLSRGGSGEKILAAWEELARKGKPERSIAGIVARSLGKHPQYVRRVRREAKKANLSECCGSRAHGTLQAQSEPM